MIHLKSNCRPLSPSALEQSQNQGLLHVHGVGTMQPCKGLSYTVTVRNHCSHINFGHYLDHQNKGKQIKYKQQALINELQNLVLSF